MAWNHIQSNSGSVSTGSTVTAAYTTGLSSGSKLIAIVCLSTDDITAPTVTSVSDGTNNFTKRVDQSMVGAAGWLSWWDLDTPAGDVGTKPTITATKAAAANNFGFTILIQEISGLAASPAFDGTAGAQAGSTTPAGTAAYSSTAANEYLQAVYGDSGSGNTIGNPTSGYTADANNVNSSTNAIIMAGYKNSSNAAESASFTSASTSWATILVAYKLAGGAAAPNGKLQPWATVPVPRRRLARAVTLHITGQPPPAAPNREPPLIPRARPPRRAVIQHVTGLAPPARPNRQPPPGPQPRPRQRAAVRHVTGSYPPAVTFGTANREPFQPSRARPPQRAIIRSVTGASPAAVTRAYRQPPGPPAARRPARAVVLSVRPRPGPPPGTGRLTTGDYDGKTWWKKRWILRL